MTIHSEIQTLKKVIIHEPDLGIEHISPEIAEQLLYDDIDFQESNLTESFSKIILLATSGRSTSMCP